MKTEGKLMKKKLPDKSKSQISKRIRLSLEALKQSVSETSTESNSSIKIV